MADTSLETVWTGGWRFRTTNQLVFINFQGKLGHVCYIWEGKNTRVRVGNMQAASAGKNTFKIKMNTSCFHPPPTMLKFGGQANVGEIDDCTVLYFRNNAGIPTGSPEWHRPSPQKSKYISYSHSEKSRDGMAEEELIDIYPDPGACRPS